MRTHAIVALPIVVALTVNPTAQARLGKDAFIEFALTPQGNPPAISPANLDKASEMLQKRSMETIELLQKYIETKTTLPSEETRGPN